MDPQPMTKSEVLLPDPPAEGPATWITNLIQQSASPDQLERAFNLFERWEKWQAEKAYWQAMAHVQARIRAVPKTRYNPGTQSKFSPDEELEAVIRPIYTEAGFSLTFTELTGARDGFICVACDVGHRLGHVRRHLGEYPLDGVGPSGNRTSMNPVQAVGSTKSYARRYLKKDIFNLTETDEDNDGQIRVNKITAEHLSELEGLLDPAEVPQFLEFVSGKAGTEVTRLDQIPDVFFLEARSALRRHQQRRRDQE